jgi:hypothetical protein
MLEQLQCIVLLVLFRSDADISQLNISNMPNIRKLKEEYVPTSMSFFPPQILPTLFQKLASLEVETQKKGTIENWGAYLSLRANWNTHEIMLAASIRRLGGRCPSSW